MANDPLYAKGAMLINNDIQLEEVKMTCKWTSGAKDVHTVLKGFAGQSPGSAMLEIDFDAAVPIDGPEYDALADILGVREVPIQVYVGNRTLTTTGFIVQQTFDHAVDSEAKVSYSIHAKYATFQ